MKISVMGLGYVGTVSAGCLAQAGHEVIGVDTGQIEVELVNAGRAPVIEKDLNEIIARQVAAGHLSATTDVAAAIQHTDLALVCVGTPGLANGGIDLKFVRRVCEEIGSALRNHDGAPSRSTRRRRLGNRSGSCSTSTRPAITHFARCTRRPPS
jgi:GDP-mannose 6-dehydrogenase